MEDKVMLEFKNLNLYFNAADGESHILRGVDIELKKGQCIAIVGESGSGKSVSVKTAVGLSDDNAKFGDGEVLYHYTDDSGKEVTVDILKKDIKWIRKNINGERIAYVFQDPMTSLDPLMTIEKQLIEGMLIHKKADKTTAKKQARELLLEVGINNVDKVLKSYPHELSGGMRQRVVIAIALSCDPEILICDEPTTALDVTMQDKILDLITGLQVKRGLSVIFITHNLGVVSKVADYIYVLYAGKVVEKGTEIDIFFDPRHPYTWGLLSAMPSLDTTDSRLYTIPGAPPNRAEKIVGDAFAPRNRYALEIDFKEEPPMFKISETHYAATWLLDERAPKVEVPEEVKHKINKMKEDFANESRRAD